MKYSVQCFASAITQAITQVLFGLFHYVKVLDLYFLIREYNKSFLEYQWPQYK